MSVKLGQFQLLEQLGKGRTSAVFRAYDPLLDRNIAIKLLDEEVMQSDREYVKEFVREAQQAALIEHPNLVQVYNVGEAAGQFYIVMELLEGFTLLNWVAQHGPMAEVSALQVAMQVADALRFAQTGQFVHGDINPRNIFITSTGNAKLLDFGLAKTAGIENPAEDGDIPDCAYYIAPERAGCAAEDPRSDIYSLGATLFYALTGRPPFQAGTIEELTAKRLNDKVPALRKLNPHVSTKTEQLIGKMLGKTTFSRYLDYDALIADLAAAGLKASTKTPQAQTVPGAAGNSMAGDAASKKSILPIIAAVSAGMLLLGGVGVFLFVHKSAGPTNTTAAASPSATPASVVSASAPESAPEAVAQKTPRPPHKTTSETSASGNNASQDSALTVAGIAPKDLQRNLGIHMRKITISFSEPVDRDSLSGVGLSGAGAAGLTPSNYEYGDKRVTFDIYGTLQPDQTYTITVPATVKSAAGKPLLAALKTTFTTEKPPNANFPEFLYDQAYAGKKIVCSDPDIKIDTSNHESPHSGTNAIKLTGSDKDAVVYFYAGTSDSGDGREGVNLSKYSSLEFWLKGDTDTAWIKMGHPVFDGGYAQKHLNGVSTEYKRFTISIPKPKDSIGVLFAITVPAGKTLFLADMKYLP